jgi:hypothetical protein
MPEGVGYNDYEADFSSGKEITYLGNGRWGGWSGEKAPASGSLDAFNFRSPDKPLMANLVYGANLDQQGENSYIGVELKIAGITVFLARGEMTNQTGQWLNLPYNIGPFLIPKRSTVQIIVTASSDAVDQFVMFNGEQF